MRKVIISGMIGNALEWYDFAIYAQFASIIGQHFFPNSDIKEILTFAVFAAGCIIRPIGGICFGNIGDKFGRRLALAIGILTMAIPTAGIGLLPSYKSIGITAPIILVIIRLIQGFSLGGEFSGCIAYIVEHASHKNRGLAGSAAFSSMCIGILLGVFVASLFRYVMTEDALFDWGWRLPFIFGLFIGVIGLYIRKSLSESPLYKKAKKAGTLSKYPLRELLTSHWRPFLLAIGLYLNVTAPFYTITVYVENFMKTLGYTQAQSSTICTAILVTLIICFPISAAVSDRIGRKPILITGALLVIISAYPVFIALGSMNYNLAFISQIFFAVVVGLYMGPIPTLLIELFPTSIRFTGVALSYNLCVAIFGGTAPMIGVILTNYTGDKYALAYYLIILAAFSLYSLRHYQETYRINLADASI